MTLNVSQFVSWAWLGTFGLWFLSSIATKRTVGSHSDVQSRVAVWVVALSWFLLFNNRLPQPLSWHVVAGGAYAGLVLTVAGLGLAIWARFSLGRNWSGMVELKQDHELIRGGPYALVRHPIYSGFMLATLGTALVYGELRGFLGFVLIVTAWGYKSRLEERFLAEQFGEEYDRYRQRFKGLIPFVW